MSATPIDVLDNVIVEGDWVAHASPVRHSCSLTVGKVLGITEKGSLRLGCARPFRIKDDPWVHWSPYKSIAKLPEKCVILTPDCIPTDMREAVEMMEKEARRGV